MKKSASPKQSEFAKSALDLDSDFDSLERISQQLEGLKIESEFGFEQARKLLLKFGEVGERIGSGIQTLAKELELARTRAENAAAKVGKCAQEVQARRNETDAMSERFQRLGEMVRTVSTSVAQLKKPGKGKLSDEEQTHIKKHLPEINKQLTVLMDEAAKLKTDSQKANLKIMEKDAHALGQVLISVRAKLAKFS